MPILSQDGFPLTANRAQLEIEYPSLPGEVHRLVDQMLEGPADRIRTSHVYVGTPAMAVQAIAMSIGGRLEGRDGPTRAIESEDMFAVAAGPMRASGYMRGFVSTVERVRTAEPAEAETSRRRFKPETLDKVFHMMANAR